MAKQINKWAPYVILAAGVFFLKLPMFPAIMLGVVLGIVSLVVDAYQEGK